MRRFPLTALALSAAAALLPFHAAHSAVNLIAIGSLDGSSAGVNADLSGLTGTLENGVNANVLGGLGSGLAWAGGQTFLALPDRGPNAAEWNAALDNTTSYLPRFHTMTMALNASSGGTLPYTLTPTLTKTTLLYSPTPLNYGPAVPEQNTTGRDYFSGRSDNFAPGASTNPANARLDPEGIRVSADGKSVFVSDEYGPYVYQFDRATGARVKTFELPAKFAAANLSASGAAEISGNTAGRVANKGMEGLAITPDGKTLVGFMQSPLIQDGGDGARYNRIVTIDIATGETHEYAYDNDINGKNVSSSEIVALNDHQFLVLARDGKGLGDGSVAKVKQVYAIDLAGAQDVSSLSGAAQLAGKAVPKKLFADLVAAFKAFGLKDTEIPAKIEGLAFGEDIVENGVVKHVLYVANDNDFLPGVAGGNRFYAFSFSDADLSTLGLSYLPQAVASVPEPRAWALAVAGLVAVAGWSGRRRHA